MPPPALVALACLTPGLAIETAQGAEAPTSPAARAAGATDGFTITATVHPAPSGPRPWDGCPPESATLAPGVTRCLVFTVTNLRQQRAIVTSIDMSLDPAYPAPPAGCEPAALSLPSLRGPLPVEPRGSATSPGLAIQLIDTPTNQDACQGAVLHFRLSGKATPADPSPDSPMRDPMDTLTPGSGDVTIGSGAMRDSGTRSLQQWLADTGLDARHGVAVAGTAVVGGTALVLLSRRRRRGHR